ncbi:MAG TPA: SMC-Scp complex subunit ScpB [Candidatus Brocadiales bacterium]|nr:SMC-Scp complex subunit ScpB [Candidatus Brocadiales bacterium]
MTTRSDSSEEAVSLSQQEMEGQGSNLAQADGHPGGSTAGRLEDGGNGKPRTSMVQDEPPVPGKGPDEIKVLVEALLFAADQPLSLKRLMEILGAEKGCVSQAVELLRQEYESTQRAFHVEEIAGGYQLLSKQEYHQWIGLLEKKNTESKLSPAALETLAIIAYKQPVLRATIEAIRGVESSQMLRSLIEKGLVKIVGKDESLGRPLLYGTTKRFLEYFGLDSLNALPRTQELSS